MDFALPSFDFAFTCFDSGWPGQGDGRAIEGEWLRKATEVAGFVGYEGNVGFRAQRFGREGGGDEGGQKWSACVRFSPRNFRKIKNLVLPMKGTDGKNGMYGWRCGGQDGGTEGNVRAARWGRRALPSFGGGPIAFYRLLPPFTAFLWGRGANGIRKTNQKPKQPSAVASDAMARQKCQKYSKSVFYDEDWAGRKAGKQMHLEYYEGLCGSCAAIASLTPIPLSANVTPCNPAASILRTALRAGFTLARRAGVCGCASPIIPKPSRRSPPAVFLW